MTNNSVATPLWTKIFLLNVLEIVLLCIIPIVYQSPGAGAAPDGATFAIFYTIGYISPDPAWAMMRQTGVLIGAPPLACDLLCLLLNLKANPKTFARSGTPRLLRIALFFFPFFLVCTSIVFSVIPSVSSMTGQSGIAGLILIIPIMILMLIPWGFRNYFTKKLIKTLTGEAYTGTIDEAWAKPLRKAILELGTKYGRLGLSEIAEFCKVAEQGKIMMLLQDMIRKQQITAQYFESTKMVAFDQQTNKATLDKFIADLEGEFNAWGKDGKKA